MTRGKKAAQAANRRTGAAQQRVDELTAQLAELKAAARAAELEHVAELRRVRREHAEQLDELVRERYGAELEQAVSERVRVELERTAAARRVELADTIRTWAGAADVRASMAAWARLADALHLGTEAGRMLAAERAPNRGARRATPGVIAEAAAHIEARRRA